MLAVITSCSLLCLDGNFRSLSHGCRNESLVHCTKRLLSSFWVERKAPLFLSSENSTTTIYKSVTVHQSLFSHLMDTSRIPNGQLDILLANLHHNHHLSLHWDGQRRRDWDLSLDNKRGAAREEVLQSQVPIFTPLFYAHRYIFRLLYFSFFTLWKDPNKAESSLNHTSITHALGHTFLQLTILTSVSMNFCDLAILLTAFFLSRHWYHPKSWFTRIIDYLHSQAEWIRFCSFQVSNFWGVFCSL